jgi:hypothetical protein
MGVQMARRSKKIGMLRDYVTKRRCHLCVIGDSTSAQNSSPRKARGVIRFWDVPWAGYSCLPFALSADEGNSASTNALGATFTAKDPQATLANGVDTNPFTGSVWDQQWSGATSNHSTFGIKYIPSSLNNYRRGDWTQSKTMQIKVAYVGEGDNIDNACPIITTNRDPSGTENDAYGNGHNLTGFSTAAAGVAATVNLNLTRTANLALSLDMSMQSGSGTSWNGKYVSWYKAFFHVPAATVGISYSTIAVSGRNTGHHMEGGDYADSAIDLEIALHGTGYPWVVWIQLGININSGASVGEAETSGSNQLVGWKNNIEAIIVRWRARLAAAGVTDSIFVVAVPWDTAADNNRFRQATDFAEELADANADVCMISYSQLLRDRYGEDWYSQGGGSGALVLADGIHQSAAGTDIIESLAWTEINRRLAAPRQRARSRARSL